MRRGSSEDGSSQRDEVGRGKENLSGLWGKGGSTAPTVGVESPDNASEVVVEKGTIAHSWDVIKKLIISKNKI